MSLYLPFQRSSRFVQVLLLTLVLGIGSMRTAQATHFRYGNISWQPVASDPTGKTIQFKVSVGYRTSYGYNNPVVVGGTIQEVDFNFGDGTTVTPNFTVTSMNVAEDYFFGEAIITHTYASTGNKSAYFTSCCRISTLINNPDETYYVPTTVNVGTANRPPITTLNPIVNVPTNQAAASILVPASDPDGDVLTYALATSADIGGVTFVQPTSLSINATTGQLTFNTVGKANGNLYNAIVKISDGKTSTIADFIIKIAGTNNAPTFAYGAGLTPANGGTVSTVINTPFTFTVRASDTDAGDVVSINAVGVPVGATFSPPLSVTGSPTATTVFSWTPTALGTYVVNFTATDLSGGQAATSVIINVIAAPVSPTNLAPVFHGPLPAQTGTVGTGFSYMLPTGTFTDPNSDPLTLTATGLPPGLMFAGGTFSGTPTTVGSYTVTLTAADPGMLTATGTIVITIGMGTPVTPGSPLMLTDPTGYTCATGKIIFHTVGGDGTAIEFYAVGVTDWTLNPMATIDQAVRNDINSQPILMRARQSGIVVTRPFDWRAYCAGTPPVTPPVTPPTPVAFALTAPTGYTCSTGKMIFNTVGGDGTTIEYFAVGVTNWTTNPMATIDQAVRNDINSQPILMQARQSGVVVTRLFDWRGFCASTRMAAEEPMATLNVRVLGNPTHNASVSVDITGAEGRSLQVSVFDNQGRTVGTDSVDQAGSVEHRTLPLGRTPGIYFLRVNTPTQTQTVKVMKH